MKPVVERVGDRFLLEREIGSGGMSTVYLGRDEVLDRPVAVKILRGGHHDSDVSSRFEREGRTAAKLSHANIVQVYDAGKDENEDREVSYIVMEYISGGDLKNLIDKDGPLSGRRLSRIGSEVADGLAHAHERDVVHRDIKPQNVLMDEYGRPKLTDFGIARALDATVQTTKTGSYLGTALYSSPEQLKGEEITPKSDVYSLGVTLYHAAVGEPPFSGGPIEVASQQMTRDPEPPRRRGAKITPEMERVILSCLSKDPESRPTSGELQTSLKGAGAVDGGEKDILGVPQVAPQTAPQDASSGGSQSGSQSGAERSPRRIYGRPEEPVSLPTRTFRSGGRDRGLFVLAGAAVLFLALIGLGVWALTGGGFGGSEADLSAPNDGAAQEEQAQDGQGNSGDESQNASEEGQGDQNATVEGGENQGDEQADEQADAQSGEQTEEQQDAQESDPGPAPPTEEASSAVYDMYVALPFERFDESWGYLSSRYQGEVGSVEDWEQRYADVSYVTYTQSPQATLDGDEARIDFAAELTRPDGPETVSGTWVAVNEDGEWKLDRLEEG